jgi:hypothetical protein
MSTNHNDAKQKNMSEGIIELNEELLDGITGGDGGGLEHKWNSLVRGTRYVNAQVGHGVGHAVNAVGNAAGTAVNVVGNAAGTAVNAVGNAAGTAVNAVGNEANNIYNASGYANK